MRCGAGVMSCASSLKLWRRGWPTPAGFTVHSLLLECSALATARACWPERLHARSSSIGGAGRCWQPTQGQAGVGRLVWVPFAERHASIVVDVGANGGGAQLAALSPGPPDRWPRGLPRRFAPSGSVHWNFRAQLSIRYLRVPSCCANRTGKRAAAAAACGPACLMS